ncbi:MAG: hypothetical protein HY804_01770 [Nitrospinae bacterium]|nr:hypothetical protein [Nitrospinota bacterium]
MSETDQPKKAATPLGALVTLSVMFPGSGQLANGQRAKGVVTIIVSALLFVDILVHTFILALPLAGAWMQDKPPVIDEHITDPLKTLLIIIGAAFAIWLWALVDTIVVYRRRETEKGGAA